MTDGGAGTEPRVRPFDPDSTDGRGSRSSKHSPTTGIRTRRPRPERLGADHPSEPRSRRRDPLEGHRHLGRRLTGCGSGGDRLRGDRWPVQALRTVARRRRIEWSVVSKRRKNAVPTTPKPAKIRDVFVPRPFEGLADEVGVDRPARAGSGRVRPAEARPGVGRASSATARSPWPPCCRWPGRRSPSPTDGCSSACSATSSPATSPAMWPSRSCWRWRASRARP